jgi:hypothetical protein
MVRSENACLLILFYPSLLFESFLLVEGAVQGDGVVPESTEGIDPETTTEPEATEPEATVPEATEPEATEPEAAEPEAAEPEAAEPEAAEPEAIEPEATEPEATEPEAAEPADMQASGEPGQVDASSEPVTPREGVRRLVVCLFVFLFVSLQTYS